MGWLNFEAVAELSGGELFEPFDQLLFRKVRIGPLLAVFQDDDRVRNVRRHRVHRRLQAVPVRAKIALPGWASMTRSRAICIASDCSSEVDGTRNACMAISLIQGRNELPPQRTGRRCRQ